MKNRMSIIAFAFTLLGTANAALAAGIAGGLPRTPLLGPPLAVTRYNPPHLNGPSDRVI